MQFCFYINTVWRVLQSRKWTSQTLFGRRKKNLLDLFASECSWQILIESRLKTLCFIEAVWDFLDREKVKNMIFGMFWKKCGAPFNVPLRHLTHPWDLSQVGTWVCSCGISLYLLYIITGCRIPPLEEPDWKMTLNDPLSLPYTIGNIGTLEFSFK